MKKLFCAKYFVPEQLITAVFVSSNLSPSKKRGLHFIKEELANSIRGRPGLDEAIDIKEVLSESDLPQEWLEPNVLIWGTEEEITAKDFLRKNRKNDPEYQ